MPPVSSMGYINEVEETTRILRARRLCLLDSSEPVFVQFSCPLHRDLIGRASIAPLDGVGSRVALRLAYALIMLIYWLAV